MKKYIVTFLMIVLLTSLCGCNISGQLKEQEESRPVYVTQPTIAIPESTKGSKFNGVWRCDPKGSFEGAEITLIITYDGNKLFFDRVSKDSKGTEFEHKQYRAAYKHGDFVNVPEIHGKCELADNCLYEVFAESGQANKFVKVEEDKIRKEESKEES